MGILNVLFYLKFRNNGSALISVLILLGFVSSLLAILLHVGKQDQKQIGQYQKNNIIYTHIHAVEDFAINILNIAIIIQIFLGILTLITGVKIYYASLHQLGSVLVLTSFLFIYYKNTN